MTVALVNSASSTHTGASGTSGTIPAATAGNLLLFAIATRGAENSPISVTGFTEVVDEPNASTVSPRLGVYYKVAVGGETSASWTAPGLGTSESVTWFAEYSGIAALSPFDVFASLPSNNTNVASQASGTTGTLVQTASYAFSFHYLRNGQTATSFALSNSFSIVADLDSSAGPSTAVTLVVGAKQLSATTAVSTTLSWGTVSDRAGGAVLVFKEGNTVTGTSARTLGSFTPAASGSSVTGTSARTLNSLTNTGQGLTAVAGTVAETLDPFMSTTAGSTLSQATFRLTPATLIWVWNIATRIGLISDVSNFEVEDRLQGAETLKFSIKADDPRVVWLEVDGSLDYENRFYRIQKLTTRRTSGGQAYVDVYAEGFWVALAGMKYIGTFTLTSETVYSGVHDIIGPIVNWTVGALTPGGGTTYSLEREDISYLQMLREWAAWTGKEIIFNPQSVFNSPSPYEGTVDLVDQQGEDVNTVFRYRWNLIEVKREVIPPTVNEVWAYGAGGINMSAAHPGGLQYVRNFLYYTSSGLTTTAVTQRFHKKVVWRNDDYTTAAELYAAALAQVTAGCYPTVTYECKVIDLTRFVDDLSTLPYDVATSFSIGDRVQIIDEVLGINTLARVTRLKRFPKDPILDEIELTTV